MGWYLRTYFSVIVQPVMDTAPAVGAVPIHVARSAVVITAAAAMQRRVRSVTDNGPQVIVVGDITTAIKTCAI